MIIVIIKLRNFTNKSGLNYAFWGLIQIFINLSKIVFTDENCRFTDIFIE